MPTIMVRKKTRGHKRRPGWQRSLERWWFTYIQPPGSPNLWLVVIPFLILGAVLFAWLAGTLAGDDVATMARDLVRNPFRVK